MSIISISISILISKQNSLNMDINLTLFAFRQGDLFDSSEMAGTCGPWVQGAG